MPEEIRRWQEAQLVEYRREVRRRAFGTPPKGYIAEEEAEVRGWTIHELRARRDVRTGAYFLHRMWGERPCYAAADLYRLEREDPDIIADIIVASRVFTWGSNRQKFLTQNMIRPFAELDDAGRLVWHSLRGELGAIPTRDELHGFLGTPADHRDAWLRLRRRMERVPTPEEIHELSELEAAGFPDELVWELFA
jgi:hypothetical protein